MPSVLAAWVRSGRSSSFSAVAETDIASLRRDVL
jgi:hypothetical protein